MQPLSLPVVVQVQVQLVSFLPVYSISSMGDGGNSHVDAWREIDQERHKGSFLKVSIPVL